MLLLGFFVDESSYKRFLFQINLTLSQNSLQVAKVTGTSRFLKFSEIIFVNLSSFWPKLNINDVMRRFCDITNLTQAFMIQ